jgi:hypothetical protein
MHLPGGRREDRALAGHAGGGCGRGAGGRRWRPEPGDQLIGGAAGECGRCLQRTCPGRAPPASAVLARRINSAVAKATSVHVAAALSQGGTTATADLSLTRADDMYGQVSYKNAPFTVLVTGGHAYVKVTSATLKALGLPSAACVLMCSKYLKMSAAQSQSMTGGLNWPSLVAPSNSLPSLHYAGPAAVNGQPAWQMRTGSGATIYVAAQGPSYPLRIVSGASHVDFTQWNSATIPPSPPPARSSTSIS